MTQTYLWNPAHPQNTRIFGWADILEEWSRTLSTSAYINAVRENLRFATEFPSSYSFPLTHFTNYLNNEQEGLKWMIYEVCAVRWMFGRVRTDYLRGLVDMVGSLDSGFPAFVGSPGEAQTIRTFLENQLTNDELDQVQMMPRLVRLPPRLVRLSPPVATSSIRTSITLRFIRDHDNAETDDLLKISFSNAYSYKIVFKDGKDNLKNRASNYSRQEVLQYLSNVLRLVAVDEQPYDSVQILAPNVPTVIISPQNLSSQMRDLIYDTVETTMDHWPIAV